jgi:NAD-dependent SIR2 family protein deacetylase
MMHHPADAAVEQAAELLRAARRVAVLKGAGISAESGLATFRGAGGLWEGHRVEAKSRHAKVIEINLTPTPATFSVDVALLGPSGSILPDLIKRL